uniref:EB domain-containing protein n=1 Tax=Ditylenchus dipsaci TaxID=166011 RepID=A0A915CU05_9BILA
MGVPAGRVPFHTANDTQDWLRRNVPNFITKKEFPPRSFDLNPLDYCIWSVLETKVCRERYDCSFSNQKSVSVCCLRDSSPAVTPFPSITPFEPSDQIQPPIPPSVTFRPPVEELSCPTGWSAYEDPKGARHFCQDSLDMTCPQGFSCAQSSVTGIFMCCRLASTIQCPRSYNTLLVNNNPRLCSIRNANTCPTGYLCLQSSVPAVYVCCSAANKNDLLCRDGQIPAYLGQFVRYCSVVGQLESCPPTYVCSASNQAGLNVCCHSTPRRSPMRLYRQESHLACGESSELATRSIQEDPLECTQNHDICPVKTFLDDQSSAVSCAQDGSCFFGHECSSHTTTKQPVCCQQHKYVDYVCPENREPYRHPIDDSYLYCDLERPVCPEGFLCKFSRKLNKRLCCSPIAFCKQGRIPLIDPLNNQAKRCFPDSNFNVFGEKSEKLTSGCSKGYSCQESTITNLFICCSAPSNLRQQTSLRLVTQSQKSIDGGSDSEWVVLEGRKR